MPDDIRDFIVGTAGHIDHGKTALVEAITEADPDRLPEEKERDLTIDLGFAEYVMPDGSEVGIIDVPGHEKFIRNMVAGATAMDFVMFVVAADDGVMPQTREHLTIMDTLGIQRGIPVITKTDLVEDLLVEVVREELQDLLAGTFMEDTPIQTVSSKTGEGLSEFRKVFEEYVDDTPEREPRGLFRMPVQRVFTVKGFGTVVTGVPVSGSVEEGDAVEVEPTNANGRVRGIQAHHREMEEARAGHRAALNLAEVHHEDVERGDVVGEEGTLFPVTILEGTFTYKSEDGDPLEHWLPIRFHVGSDEVTGRLIPLDREEIKPGETSWVQYQLDREVVTVPGDPYVLRRQSPMVTLGGGRVVGLSDRRMTRSDEKRLERLKKKGEATGSWQDRLKVTAADFETSPFNLRELCQRCFVNMDRVRSLMEEEGPELLDLVVLEGTDRYVHETGIKMARERIVKELENHHADQPLLLGLKKFDLHGRTDLNSAVFEEALRRLREAGEVEDQNGFLRLANHQVEPSEREEQALSEIRQRLEENPYNTPRPEELKEHINEVEEETVAVLLQLLIQRGEVVRLQDNVLMRSETLEEAEEQIRDRIREQGHIETAEFRDMVDTSRKYAIPILEYFDEEGVTYREENRRYLVEEDDG